MVEKMKFLTITGPKNDIDRVTSVYLSKYEIHLENALSELNIVQDLKPFVEVNPYKEPLGKAQGLIEKLNKQCIPSDREITPKEAIDIISNIYLDIAELGDQKGGLKQEKQLLQEKIEKIEPFRLLDYNLGTILDFKFIKFRFGRISHEFYDKVLKYVYDNLSTVFLECDRDNEYVWGVYFVPAASAVKVDAVYASLHFERILLPAGYDGTPEEVYQTMLKELKELRQQSKAISNQIKEKINSVGSDLLLAYQTLEELADNFEIRKLAACTKEKGKEQVFYILCGWMTEKESKRFLKATENDANVYCITDDNHDTVNTIPPTKLKNPKLFKPFEMFINMYGLPAYNEMDPTIFVALTYTFMFGIMFGDIGQGLCLVVGGFLLYKIKKMNIAAVISIAGLWSTFFGFMYGSLFGFEEILEPVWRRPMEDIMSTLMTAVAFGVGLILVAMVLNIINGIKAKNVEKIFFDPSGLAGLLCYGSVVVFVLLMLTGHTLPGTIVLCIIVGVPLLAIFLKEPLTKLVKKESKLFPPGSKVMFFVEAFVELFDVVLSYATNTISFVRIGAFALSHAGMMGVVLSLANIESGNPNLLIIILGNIVVTGLEGLVVGIQVLRLEYYEMFSRFYRGTGKEFKPYKSKES